MSINGLFLTGSNPLKRPLIDSATASLNLHFLSVRLFYIIGKRYLSVFYSPNTSLKSFSLWTIPVLITWFSSFMSPINRVIPFSAIFYLYIVAKYGTIDSTNAILTLIEGSLTDFSTYWKNTLKLCCWLNFWVSYGNLRKAIVLTSASESFSNY